MKYFLIFSLLCISLFAGDTISEKEVTQLREKLYKTSTRELINGTIVTKFDDGTLRETLSVVEGVPNGISIGYYPTGIKKFELHYKDGKFDGPAIKYYENGNINTKMTFKEDKLDGLVELYKEDGTFDKKVTREELLGG